MPTQAAGLTEEDVVEEPGSLVAMLRSPSEILFGTGQRAALGQVARRYGPRAFVCADPFLADGSHFKELIEGLREAGLSVVTFTEVVPDLPVDGVAAAVSAARQCGADVVIAIGGGSCIDLAKVTALLLSHGGELEDYYGEFRVPGPVVPIIAVPTTSGTGSEVTPVAVVTDPRRTSKIGISSPYLIPDVAICDPILTLSCPPAVTASSGTDALSHCIEAYTAVRRSSDPSLSASRVFVGRGEITDAFALTGLRHIVAGLPTACIEPSNIPARSRVMLGSLMAGLAFGTAGTAAAHAIQYPLGALTHTPHGVGVGAILPFVMEFNLKQRVPEMAAIGRIFGVEAVTETELAAKAPDAVARFLAGIGIPSNLALLGVPEERLDWVAEQSMKATRLVQNNPEPLTVMGVRGILQAAMSGPVNGSASLASGTTGREL